MAGARQLRAVLYLRQSQTREDSISLDLQERACREHCTRKGYTVVAIEADPGLSGGSLNRPGFQRMLTMVKQRQADVIVLWKWSRFSRKRLDWYAALAEVEQHGGHIESATEDIDTTTSVGRLSRGVLVELAAFERERISDQWKEVWQRRAHLGLADGQPRFGYRIHDGLYEPDPDVAGAVEQVYRWAVEGRSFRSLALWLNAQGHLTPKGGTWQGSTLRESLRNGFPAGLIRHKDQFLPGVHEPIINAALWKQFQALLPPAATASRARKHLLSGLLRCAYCGGLLYAYGRKDAPDGYAFRCGKWDRKEGCPAGGVTAWPPSVTAAISVWLAEQVEGEQEEYERRVAEWRKRPQVDVAPQRRALVKVETDLLSLAKKNLDGFYDDDTYLSLRAELLDKQRVLTKQIAEAALEEPQQRDYRLVREVWETALEEEERRHALTLLLSHVLVRKRPDGPKYEPVPHWVVTS